MQWAVGDFARGVAEARKALDGDPLSVYLTFLFGACLLTAGRQDEAIEACRRAAHQDPDSFVARWLLGVSLSTAGRFDEAIGALEIATQMSHRHLRALTSLAIVFGRCGQNARACDIHRELRQRATYEFVPLTYLALTAESAGDIDDAVALARQAWNDREPTFLLHARHFPEFRTLRADMRFAAIIREQMTLAVGTRLGAYEILTLLGSGGHWAIRAHAATRLGCRKSRFCPSS